MLKIVQLERVEPEVAAPPATATNWGNRQRLLFLGLLIAGVGLLVISILYFTWPHYPPLDEFTPRMAYEAWQVLRMGIDRPVTDVERIYEAKLSAYRQWMVIAVAVSVAGLLIVSGSWFVGRPRRLPGKDRP